MPSYNVVVLDPATSEPQSNVAVEARRLSDGTILDVQTTNIYGVASFVVSDDASFHARTWDTPPLYQVTQDGREGLVNVDYVVDSAGRGTHTELFSPDGALEDAIATGGDRVIWVCSGHSETISTTHALTNLADGQEITVMSAGINRPSFTVAAGLGANALINHGTANSGGGDGSRLRFQGVSFTRPSAATAGPWFTGTGGWDTPDIDLIDVTFSGAAGKWTAIFGFTGTSADVEDILLERVVSDVNIGAVVEIAGTGALGKFVISNCDFASLDYIQKRAASTDVDVGRDGIIITDNLFRVITVYGWSRTYDTGPGDYWPFVFTGNIILDFQGAAPCLQIGTPGTTSPTNATIDGNFIRCSNDHADTRAVKITGGAGTAENISVCGNALQGPGGAAAHMAVEVDIANTDCLILNSYRDWDTNVGGSYVPATSIPGDACMSGDVGITGYLRVGSCAAPDNTTPGDLTAERLFIPSLSIEGVEDPGVSTSVILSKIGTTGVPQQFRYEFPDATDEDVLMRFLRTTNTSGARSFTIYKGDGTSTVIFELRPDLDRVVFGSGVDLEVSGGTLEFTTSGNPFFNLNRVSGDQTLLEKPGTGGAQQLRYEFPDVTTEDALMRFFRTTDTDGTVAFEIFTGEGSTDLMFRAMRDSAGVKSVDAWNFTQHSSTWMGTSSGDKNFGNTSIGASEDSVAADEQNAVKVTLETCYFHTIYFYGRTLSGTANVRLCLYDDNAGVPGNLLVYTEPVSVTTTAAWRSVEIPWTYYLVRTYGTYWITVLSEDAFNLYYDTGASGDSYENNPDTYSGGPEDPWVGGSSGNKSYSLYAVAEPTIQILPIDDGGIAKMYYRRSDDTQVGPLFGADGEEPVDKIRIMGGAGDYGSPTNGQIWYNTTTEKFRGYEDGAWADMIYTDADARAAVPYVATITFGWDPQSPQVFAP